ncbi:unnamed protein product [Clonostachys byssicola]|uniref:DUF7580 domain-containing protein n=1 Tax=Clonostachys byssicola TaxID=160290 RepID=A0A9N9XXL7_9HYPO|nr:unnamed protein product [Clonostachys byssicola]
MEPGSSPNYVDQLNKGLKALCHGYTSVSVLVLYWQDGDEGYKKEGQAVRQLFEELFHYSVTEFAIPTEKSIFHLRATISQKIMDLAEPSLLIIHYGGHGDRDDDKHSNQECRSVWAAHQSGGPTLDWWRIQDEIKNCESDKMLLLDCCYAAQAARDRDTANGKFEILAAAAMGVKTPAPGDSSFTQILIKEMESTVRRDGFIVAKDLHGQLCHRSRKLYTTPVHIRLQPGKKLIRLSPLSANTALDEGNEAVSPFLKIIIKMREELNYESTVEMAEWLKDAPRNVSGLKVLEKTEFIEKAVHNVNQGSKEFTKQLRPGAKEEIGHAWSKIVALVNQHHESFIGGIEDEDKEKRRRVFDLVKRLDAENNYVVDLVERHILTAPNIDEPDVLQGAVQDDTMQSLGISDQLHMRCIISSASRPCEPEPSRSSRGQIGEDMHFEIKHYGSYIDPREKPGLEERARRLSELLKAPKDAGFRTLHCTGYENEELTHQYRFSFSIPEKFHGFQKMSLNDVIVSAKGKRRPSLNDRLRIAHILARAVQKWHIVGWVHQGISSHDIIFFRDKTTKKIDYSEPFLHGFEFARPDSDPSIGVGRALDDIKFNIFRHPERQGTARKGHQKKHDLYSLGVVLLEIGLWQDARDIVRSKPGVTLTAADLQTMLQKDCRDRLAHFIGTSYQAVVDICLSSDFGVDVDDTHGSYLAKAFQAKVVDELAKGVTFLY